MEYLKNADRLSFLYGGKDWLAHKPEVIRSEDGEEIRTVYRFADGLTVTNHARRYVAYGAWEWYNVLENTGDRNTAIISELWDCDCKLAVAHREQVPASPWNPSMESATYVLNPNGSTTIDEYDFYTHVDDSLKRSSFLLPFGKPKGYTSRGGRSSDGNAPYFNIHEAGKGYFVAIGWTGQWNAQLSRTGDTVHVQSKIGDTHFYLMPGERIRTSSVLIMPYECAVEESFNLWRRFLREKIVPIGGGCEGLPLALSIWGGTESAEYIRRMEYAIEECKIPFNYVWMDAGWAGIDTLPTRNEFSGDWASHVGDFRVSPTVHPNGLVDVADWIHSHGKKFILWFEPERVRKSVALVKEHPEYLLFDKDPANKNCLLNLGDEAAFQYCLATLSELIERLHVDCYRQDFNMSPLSVWRSNDTPDRQGITEIKCITGLYRLWDSLLARFPWLFIDNCASGGKRLDIEMMKRSIPLWRSDAQCPADPIPEITQANHMNFSLWMPYSGTGSGRVYDTYSIRSAYATALSTTYSYSNDEHFGEDPAQVSWLKARCEEYLRVRPYFEGDLYHLTSPVRDDTTWCGMQWHRSEVGDGMIQIFKRQRCPYPEAVLELRGIDPAKIYHFTDIDGGEWELDGKTLAKDGFCLRIEEKRAAKIYFYAPVGEENKE